MTDVNWGKLGKDFWFPYANLTVTDKIRFLREYKLQKKNVPQCRQCQAVFYHCYCDDLVKNALHAARRAEYQKSFYEKVEHAQQLVNQVLEEHKGRKIFLAYSGGIDSECCVQLFKEAIMDGRVTIISADTLCDFPQTHKRWDECEEELGVKIVFSRPDIGMSFKVIADTVGLPIYARGHADPEKRKATELCCKNLKKKNMKKIQKNADVLIMGLRGEENENRRKKTIQYGDYFYAKSEKQWHVLPIAYWSIEDVWKFQEFIGFKYSGLYDLTNCNKKGFFLLPNGEYYQIRTGCIWCPQAIDGGYLIWLETYFPRHYDCMINKLGLKNHVVWAKVQYRMKQLKSKQYQLCGMYS